MENALTILGSSSALPTSQRFSTAQVLQMLGRFFLIDCGEGTQIQLRRCSIPFTRIQAIFISHLHGDHYLGIFGVLSSFNLLGRRTPLTIYAPKGFENIVNFQLKYLVSELSFKVTFIELTQNGMSCIYSDKKIDVYSISLDHRLPTWGFYFKEKAKDFKISKKVIEKYSLSIAQIVLIKKGEDLLLANGEVIPNSLLVIQPESPKSYAYISDTLYKPQIAEYIKDVTLLYHESTFSHEMLKRAKETFHSTAKQAAEFANFANAEKLLLGHFSARYKTTNDLEKEAKVIFPNTIAVNDLDIYSF